MAWTEQLGRLRGRGVRRGLGDALYAIAALWLSAFTAYLVYLLLPFEYLAIGLFELSPIAIIFSALLAAIVALAVLVWLVRRLLRPAWRGEAIGGWRFGIVVALAVATLTFDAGWTHFLVPFPPAHQDDCSFGTISREEYGTIAHDMEQKSDPDWLAVFAEPSVKEEFERQLVTMLPEITSEARMIARIHALARAIGGELDSQGFYHDRHADYDYRFDFNDVPFMRQIVLRWAEIQFNIVKINNEVKLEDVLIFLPTIGGREQHPPRERTCPSLPQPVDESSINFGMLVGASWCDRPNTFSPQGIRCMARIFLESKPVTGTAGTFGHLYLVRREDGAPVTNQDEVITGAAEGPLFFGPLVVRADEAIGETPDEYDEENGANRGRVDITTFIPDGAARWDDMVAFARDINSSGYDYDFPPIGAANANSNAVVFSQQRILTPFPTEYMRSPERLVESWIAKGFIMTDMRTMIIALTSTTCHLCARSSYAGLKSSLILSK